MRFARGILGHMQCSFGAAEHQLLEVIGSEGTATAGLAFTAWRDDATTLQLQRGSQTTHEHFAPSDPYQSMVEHFAAVIRQETPLLYPPQEAIQVLSVLDTIRAQW
jgi:predicted dehydrogenase